MILKISYWDDSEEIPMIRAFAEGAIEGIHGLVCDMNNQFFLEDAWLSYSDDVDINIFWTNSDEFDGMYSAVAYPVINEKTNTDDEIILFGVI